MHASRLPNPKPVLAAMGSLTALCWITLGRAGTLPPLPASAGLANLMRDQKITTLPPDESLEGLARAAATPTRRQLRQHPLLNRRFAQQVLGDADAALQYQNPLIKAEQAWNITTGVAPLINIGPVDQSRAGLEHHNRCAGRRHARASKHALRGSAFAAMCVAGHGHLARPPLGATVCSPCATAHTASRAMRDQRLACAWG